MNKRNILFTALALLLIGVAICFLYQSRKENTPVKNINNPVNVITNISVSDFKNSNNTVTVHVEANADTDIIIVSAKELNLKPVSLTTAVSA